MITLEEVVVKTLRASNDPEDTVFMSLTMRDTYLIFIGFVLTLQSPSLKILFGSAVEDLENKIADAIEVQKEG